jgi:methionyl-tRNA formyltransferase
MKNLKVVFMGTPAFAVVALQAILAAGHQIVAVYTQPPRPAGRGQLDRPSPVHEIARARQIPVRCPTSLRDPQEALDFQALRADVAVVVAYGLILPSAILAAPRFGCFNIHASLLPRWRGAAPIERAILEGDQESGVTIMRMDEGLDTGPIAARSAISITAGMDAGELRDRLAELGAQAIVQVLAKLPSGLESRPQAKEGASYAPKIAKEEARLDWQKSAQWLERKVRAFRPRPGAFAVIGGERVKVHGAEADAGVGGEPGVVLDDRLLIACGSGALRLTRLQRPGRAAMSAEEFLRGFRLAKGERLP